MCHLSPRPKPKPQQQQLQRRLQLSRSQRNRGVTIRQCPATRSDVVHAVAQFSCMTEQVVYGGACYCFTNSNDVCCAGAVSNSMAQCKAVRTMKHRQQDEHRSRLQLRAALRSARSWEHGHAVRAYVQVSLGTHGKLQGSCNLEDALHRPQCAMDWYASHCKVRS